jgi:lipoprotein-anchoring transpeptidase ErfK/SrfK
MFKNVAVPLMIVLLFSIAMAQDSKEPETSPMCNVPRNLRVQILLDAAGFSPGEIDGQLGSNVRHALIAFQESKGLKANGIPNSETIAALSESPFDVTVSYTITGKDVDGPFTESVPQDALEKAKLPALNYTSEQELLSEKFHVSPEVLRSMNPKSKFESGDQICVPNVLTGSKAPVEKQKVTITVSEKKSDLVVQNDEGKIIFFAPVTAGSEHDPLPEGTWKVTGVTENPNFYYNPDLFWDADSTHSKATIRPGPNNPVGIIWIGLTAEHYGLHGTPEPGKIGHSESYGCVRLTNWDIARLAKFVKPGTQVIFSDGKKLAKR